MTSQNVTIRQAAERDLEAVGRLGARLLRAHHEFDPLRFMAPRENTEEGYAWFLGTQLQRDDAVVFVAERDGLVVGYVYASIEPQFWKELREEAGFIHDVYVDDAARRLFEQLGFRHTMTELTRETGVGTNNDPSARTITKL